MKVFHINSVYQFGSTGKIVKSIHEYLKNCGHESIVAYGRNFDIVSDEFYKIGNKLSLATHLVGSRVLDKHGLFSDYATRKLIQKIKEVNPDIIHLHNLHGYYLNYKILLEFLSHYNKPVVWTLHDCWAFTGHCAYFSYHGCEKWKEGCHNCPLIKSYPSSLFIDRSKSNYQLKKKLYQKLNQLTIITPSIWLKDLVQESILKKFPIEVINNGIETTQFKYLATNSSLNDTLNLLAVASIWEERKGLSHLKELSHLLKANMKLTIIGRMTQEQVEWFKDNSQVTLIERTENVEKLCQEYNKAHIFINPTLEDNFPTTNIEALCCGTPVITYKTGGSVEVVNTSNGLVTKQNTPQSLLQSIIEVSDNTYDRKKISLEACQKYSVEKFVLNNLDIYNKLMKGVKI